MHGCAVHAHWSIGDGDGLIARISSNPLCWGILSGGLPDVAINADNQIDHHGHIVVESFHLRVPLVNLACSELRWAQGYDLRFGNDLLVRRL